MDSWFAIAEDDLEAAEILSQQVKPKLEIVCYHCQQAAEKYLKGFIASRGGKLQKTHDLVVLCELCTGYDICFAGILEICSDLSVYATEIRYPNSLDITVEDMKLALSYAAQIKKTVTSSLH